MPATELTARLRDRAGAGEPLPAAVRGLLETRLGADLGAVRVHTDTPADAMATGIGADAFASGADIYFRAGAFDPASRDGLRLLAHEVVHTLQQAAAPSYGGGTVTIDADPAQEAYAGRVAAAFVAGEPIDRTGLADAVRRVPAAAVQRHASWEHRLLGDARPADLDAIARRMPNRTQLLTELRDFLWMWHQDPDSVSEEMIAARYPYIRTVRLKQSNLLVTYGELNTLPDYMANPTVLDAQPRAMLLPILQAVRQEGYNRVQNLLGGSTSTFSGAIGINTGWSMMDLIVETKALDSHTWNIGPNHTNHYTALVARNACHFAPYSWYRWEQFYLMARKSATKAHDATEAAEKAAWTYDAWMNLGYADHFLQDSFAAGHLVNKTLVMQWFVDWVKDKWYVPVADWEAVKWMTADRQPGVSAQRLYDMSHPGNVRDPQTAEEQPSIEQRMAMCGVAGDGKFNQRQAYTNYLAFLDSTVVQSASGVLHDYFNSKSLWVSSATEKSAYQIWGDDTMLDGGDGVRIAAETAQLSQQSILELLARGETSIEAQHIKDRFPTAVLGDDNVTRSLPEWHTAFKEQAYSLFPTVHYYVLRAFPRIGYVSVDQAAQAVAMLNLPQQASLPAWTS